MGVKEGEPMAGDGPVVVTGGTGLVGGALLERLGERGVPVRALVRRPGSLAGRKGTTEFVWDGIRPPPDALEGAAAVVHLSGEPVFGGLPTDERKKRLRSSRVASTESIVTALQDVPALRRPHTVVCASAVGYYGDRGEERLDETSEPGEGFLAELCVDWESAAAEAARFGVRVCSLRIGVVLSRDGGALPLMARPFRFGVGGVLGDGQQWFPWIHLDDLVGMLLAALGGDAWKGPVNAVAPQPVRNETLTRTLGKLLRRPTFMRVPGFAVKAVLGELSGELLGSKRVIAARAEALGFDFVWTELEPALRQEL